MSTNTEGLEQEKMRQTGFFSEMLNTFKEIFSDSGIIMMLIVAPMIYGFFYPWPYNSEVVQKAPVAIVDYDHTHLSRTLVRYADSNPKLEVRILNNKQAAKEAIWRQQIAGYMVIPQGLEDSVASGKLAQVSVAGNAGYFLLNKTVLSGFSQSVGTVAAVIKIKKNVAHGAFLDTAQKSSQKIAVKTMPLFNVTEGYGAYVVPGVSILIIQQVLLMGAAMLIGTWFEKKRYYTSALGWAGRIAALSFIAFMLLCFYYGWIFTYHNYTSGQNLAGSLLFLLVFCPTIATLGCLIGMVLRGRERSLQLLIFSSLPAFFLSGFPWPEPMLPESLRYIGMLLPSTHGINTSLQLNQMGASLSHVLPSLYALMILTAIYFILLLVVTRSIYNKEGIHNS